MKCAKEGGRVFEGNESNLEGEGQGSYGRALDRGSKGRLEWGVRTEKRRRRK